MTRRVSAGSVVYATLYDQITSMEIEPGTRLSEVALAASLEVSRTPLREALRMLLNEGLVVQLPTGGMVVRGLDTRHLSEIYMARAALEQVIVREACQRINEEQLRALESVLQQVQHQIDYPDAVMRISGDFHGKIGEIAGNSVCTDLLDQLKGHNKRYRVLAAENKDRRLAALAEHWQILEALRAKDPNTAAEVINAHLMAGLDRGLALLKEAGID
ncbi:MULTISPECIES: GntR family transcriptional regulator [unclassified Streptomyces]